MPLILGVYHDHPTTLPLIEASYFNYITDPSQNPKINTHFSEK